jgi:hypothetical protein
MECGEQCRRPKRFCSDAHKELWLSGRGIVVDHRGAEQVERQRRIAGITPESLEWRRKRNVGNSF